MKRILLTTILTITVGLLFAQTTYYWVGGTASPSAPATVYASANWNTSIDGSGTFRTIEGKGDILIVDGSNVGGAIPTVGPVYTSTSSTHFCGQLKMINGANFTIGRISTGSASFRIYGDATPADDLVIDSSSTFLIGGPVSSALPAGLYDVNIPFGPQFGFNDTLATATISGNLYLGPISNTLHTRSYITVANNSKLTFATGASCYINDSTATSGFNNSDTMSVTFKTGANLYYYAGRSPIATSSTVQVSNFEPGSNLYIRGSNVSYLDGITPYSSSSWSNNKFFGNIFIQNGSTFKADGSFFKIENLTIDAGSTLLVDAGGYTPVLGNLTVNGILSYPAIGSTNTLLMAGSGNQIISGTGTIKVPVFAVSNNAAVTLNKDITVDAVCNIFGKINFGSTFKINGAGSFVSKVNAFAAAVTANSVADSYQISGIVAGGITSSAIGLRITGPGIQPNTNVVFTSSSNGFAILSKPILATSTGSNFSFVGDTATLETSNANGMDSVSGSVVVTGVKSFQPGTNYIFNGATSSPFGVSSGFVANTIKVGRVEVNAPVTVNKSILIDQELVLNSKLTLRPLDTVSIAAGALISGNFNASNYIVTDYNASNGQQSVLQYNGLTSAVTLPIGTATQYLPATITAAVPSSFTAAVFEGVTQNGSPTGTPLTAVAKRKFVDAVWNIQRSVGTGDATLQLGWNSSLEGGTFASRLDSDIGISTNDGNAWLIPVGSGDNNLNTVTAVVNTFGAFAASTKPPLFPFTFNMLPAKTYGDPDFYPGASSENTTDPIVYSSSNTAVATIVNDQIHIVGVGTADITAAQATDGTYPAASITRSLVVNKAPLTIKAVDKIKFEGEVNPTLTVSYTGFVLNETSAVLTSLPSVSTTAVTASPIGTYPITASGASASNYSISYLPGILTVQAKQNQTITFNALPIKTYGNADFTLNATSSNNSIPVTYVSSNPLVATVAGNVVHIVGAGTADIIASQAGSTGYYPAANITRTLTVNKAVVTVSVVDTFRNQGLPNPVFSFNYNGFVLGENSSVLTTFPIVTTLASTNSTVGIYATTPAGATAANYNFIYVGARLTIYPPNGASQQYFIAYLSSSNTLSIKFYSPVAALGDIVLYDMLGRPIAIKNVFIPENKFSTAVLNVGHLPSGNYVLMVRGKNIDLVKQIAIIRN